jgi:hypothetical protein
MPSLDISEQRACILSWLIYAPAPLQNLPLSFSSHFNTDDENLREPMTCNESATRKDNIDPIIQARFSQTFLTSSDIY